MESQGTQTLYAILEELHGNAPEYREIFHHDDLDAREQEDAC